MKPDQQKKGEFTKKDSHPESLSKKIESQKSENHGKQSLPQRNFLKDSHGKDQGPGNQRGDDAIGKAGKPFEDGMIGFDPVTDHHCCEAPDVGRKDG